MTTDKDLQLSPLVENLMYAASICMTQSKAENKQNKKWCVFSLFCVNTHHLGFICKPIYLKYFLPKATASPVFFTGITQKSYE